MKRLAIITTHPIQYNAPLFKLLHQRGNIEIKVFYTWGEEVLQKKFDPGFGKIIQWDIPLLEGYEFEFVKNISTQPGSHHFKGIDNPALIKEIEEWNADAILIFGWNFRSHLKALRFFHQKMPVIFRGDSTLLDNEEAIVFLFAGKLEHKKNPGLLLHVFTKMNDPEAHLIVVGNGELEEILKSEYKANQKIHFIPFQNQTQMPGLYSACDVFVLPSQGPGETWGLSVNEAMACGKAVLVSNKCGCATNLVKNGINGYVFESGNSQQLVDKIKLLAKDKNIIDKMGQQSLEMIKEWNFENAATSIENVMADIQ